jgi:hypothetical protein
VREEFLRRYLLKMNLPFPRRPYPWSGASKVSFNVALNVLQTNALPFLAPFPLPSILEALKPIITCARDDRHDT